MVWRRSLMVSLPLIRWYPRKKSMRKKRSMIIVPMLCLAITNSFPVYATSIPETSTVMSEESEIESVGDVDSPETGELDSEESNEEETDAIETVADNLSGNEGITTDEEIISDVDTETGEAETEDAKSLHDTENPANEASGENTTNSMTDENLESAEDSITVIETEPVMDENGNVTVEVSVADNVTLPVEITMKGSEGAVTFSVVRNEQPIKMKPDTYKITKVLDGNHKKLAKGAYLTIPEDGGIVYLDFTKPESSSENTILAFIRTNIFFIPFAAILCLFFRWYIKRAS